MIDNEERVNTINNIGITIINHLEQKFFPLAQTKLTEIEPSTLILLTTKAHQSGTALKPFKNLLLDDTIILILQNGLGNEEAVKRVVGERQEIIRGIVNIGAWEVEPGKINLTLRETVIEPTETGRIIAQLFNSSAIPARVSDNFATELWIKLVLNCVLNPLTAILKVRNYQVAAPVLENLRRQIVEECLNVGKVEGVDLPLNLTEGIDNLIQGYTNFSSMYQDVVKGKRTEIDFLNGKIIELAARHNLPVPCNQTLTAIIKFLESENET